MEIDKIFPPVPKARLRQLARLGSRKLRRKEGFFVADGARLVEEALASGIEIGWAACAPDADDRSRALAARLAEAGVEVFRAERQDLERTLDAAAPQALAAVCRIPRHSLEEIKPADKSLLAVCDGIGEPGNLGSVIRAAAAAGCQAVLLAPGTVDPYNPRCVHGAMGALFRIPVIEVQTALNLAGFLEKNKFSMFCAAAGGDNIFSVKSFPLRCALFLGGEPCGPSKFTDTLAPRRLGIPLAAGVESLNVAVAAGIILYRMAELQEDGR